jgi:hypothetical protein
MCLGSSPSTPPSSPAPARPPARLDLADLEQSPSAQRKKKSKGKRSLRNSGDTGLNLGGINPGGLNIPKN